ncbi:hypothetical protein GO986_18010 [Deinococcus sp. HMF7620]|uniref:Uncharacterized protein n=1 Tax=Deinococcus arboris TaxID=2682977 RepID=A0A7C9HTL1_9DEIO|nr:hypothetical protein [Deinococcus arboris]MVN88634.1 hypothetical protein [Deinococcus arboris]
MTLTVPEFPLSLAAGLQHLQDALGEGYGGNLDTDALTRALSVDALRVDTAVHPRPWATAARLITDNTEYEVSKGLNARIDRKLSGLEEQQMQADAIAGILHLLPRTDETSWPPRSGSVATDGVF